MSYLVMIYVLILQILQFSNPYQLNPNKCLKFKRTKLITYDTDPNFQPINLYKKFILPKYIKTFGVLPMVSLFLFPSLLHSITDQNLSYESRQLCLISLLFSKRAILYTYALNTVELSAIRMIETAGPLGQRMLRVNSEMFSGVPLLKDYTASLEMQLSVPADTGSKKDVGESSSIKDFDRNDKITRLNEDNKILYVSGISFTSI